MKKLIGIAVALTIAILSCFNVFAAKNHYADEEYGFSITLPNDYIILNRTNLSSNSDFIKRLGYSVKSFKLRMEESGILLYSADNDNQHQIQLKSWESDFSKEVGSLSSANSDQLSEMLYVMSEQLELEGGRLIDSRVTDVSGKKYLTYTVEVDGAFCFVQSVTVENGKCYSLIYYNSAAEFSQTELDEQKTILKSLNIKKAATKTEGKGYFILIRIISAVVAIVALIVAVFLISSFVRDIKRRKDQPEIIPDRIKMRRK